MAVHIRLRRIGKNPKKRPHFRVTVFDERRGRDSRFLEELGYYNPVNDTAKIKLERIDYWTKHGAQLSDTVKRLIKKLKKSNEAQTYGAIAT
ncbi:MAG: 30S ribosomal protein S16 [Candidatus Omnitrophica bacterium]|nr:30S ribosomal protein S16 [Candidatus Omnitrophota bacterium]MBI5145243.1 30S ribosomal protein S16 [Candidatus Omnitrophota bacterium]